LKINGDTGYFASLRYTKFQYDGKKEWKETPNPPT